MVGEPLAKALAAINEVFGIARFTNAKARARSKPTGCSACRSTSTRATTTRLPDDCRLRGSTSPCAAARLGRRPDRQLRRVGLLMSALRVGDEPSCTARRPGVQPNGPPPLRRDLTRSATTTALMQTYFVSEDRGRGRRPLMGGQCGCPPPSPGSTCPIGDPAASRLPPRDAQGGHADRGPPRPAQPVQPDPRPTTSSAWSPSCSGRVGAGHDRQLGRRPMVSVEDWCT